MPAQKRPLPAPSDHLAGSTDNPHLPPPLPSQQQHQLLPQADGEQPPQYNPPLELPKKQDGDSDGEGGSQSSDDEADKEEIILVKLADIRKEVQCPICLVRFEEHGSPHGFAPLHMEEKISYQVRKENILRARLVRRQRLPGVRFPS